MTQATRKEKIERLRRFPRELRATVERLNDEQLDTAYGPGKWTIRQVVHHLPDSHMNAYIRLKLILTEDNPTLKTYDQALWAEVGEARTGPIEPSLRIIEGLHARWADLFDSLSDSDFARSGKHPEHNSYSVSHMLDIYFEHCDKHLGHINGLKQARGWK